MTDALLEELLSARRARTPFALVTVAATTGSVPREAGAKMIVYADGITSGTVGGGKFESLVIEATLARLREKTPLLEPIRCGRARRSRLVRFAAAKSRFLIEPQNLNEAIFLIGAGHCAQAIATLSGCGLLLRWWTTRELTEALPANAFAVARKPSRIHSES
jgi:xanthine dehydrogenase accessory factor